MRVFEPLPAPAGGDAQHSFGQGTEVIGDLLDAQDTFYVPGKCAKNLGMMGTSQQVQTGFFVVFTGAFQGVQAKLQFVGKDRAVKTLVQHVVVGQLVNHTGVQQQVTCRPSGRAQQAQQPLMYQWTLQQQCQVIFAPKQRLYPVDDAHSSLFAHSAFAEPQSGALHQPAQAGA